MPPLQHPIRRLTLLTVALFALASSSCDQPKTGKDRTDIPTFLTQYDPALHTRRNELIASIRAAETQIATLKKREETFEHQGAKAKIQRRIAALEADLTKLNDILTAIDAKVEMALASEEIGKADHHGLQSREIQTMLSEADSLIHHSQALDQTLSEEHNGIPSIDPPTPTRSSPTAGKTPAAPPAARADLQALREELTQLDQRIAEQRARWQDAIHTINRLTNFKRTPVREGSEAYYRCVEASQIITEVEHHAPGLKAQRSQLLEQIQALERP